MTMTQSLKTLMHDRGIPSLQALSTAAQVSLGSVKRLKQGRGQTMQVQTIAKLAQVLAVPIETLIQLSSEPLSTDSLPLEKKSEKELEEIPIAKISEEEPKNLAEVGSTESTINSESLSDSLREEYDRLRQQLKTQEKTLQEEFKRDALQILEPWLLQWSAAAYAAQNNPQLMAVKLLPLVRPIETLLIHWGVEPIGAVGEEVEYNPRLHQLLNSEAESVELGTIVRVRFAGYGYRDKEHQDLDKAINNEPNDGPNNETNNDTNGGQILHRAKVVRV